MCLGNFIDRPNILEYVVFSSSRLPRAQGTISRTVDNAFRAVTRALDATVLVPPAVKSWYTRRLVYLPFATRIHVTHAPEFRTQITGFHLVYALLWNTVDSSTVGARQYREKMAAEHRWDECMFAEAGPGSGQPRKPVSSWVKVIVHPGNTMQVHFISPLTDPRD